VELILRVLLINDDEDSLFLLERATAREFPAATFFRYKCPREALDLLGSHAVDAIITDNRMPEMSGVAMVRRIRARDQTTPILMLTGSGEVEAEAFAAGVTGFLAGGNWGAIRDKIRELLRPPRLGA
jgi:CheY-like chemotaxis protein